MTPFEHENLEDLFEHAPCGYLSLHPDGRIARVNATLLDWTGHGRDDLQECHFRDLLTVPGRIYFDTHVRPLLRIQGVFNEVALDILSRDKVRIPVLVNATERRDENGAATAIRVTVFKATDRRTYETEMLAARDALADANEELRAVNERLDSANRDLDRANRELRAFYETLPVGIFRADAEGRIVQASPRFRALFGVTEPEAWMTHLSAEDRAASDGFWTQARETRGFVSRLFRRVADGGKEQIFDMKVVATHDPETGLRRFVGVVEDVTAKIAADIRHQQSERETAIIQLTGGLAHNLNNILAVAMGNFELLEDELMDRPQLRPIFEAGKTAMDRAAALVSRLVVYSGKSFAATDRVEADVFLGELAARTRPRLAGMHCLTCDTGASGAAVELGADMLREAMDELIANAVAGMPAGGDIRLSSRRVRATEGGSHGDMVVLAVRDSGTGMDKATLEKAREPFFTGRSFGERMGLGLSLVDGIARIAGGELRLHSTPGKGTIAELWLPVVDLGAQS